MCAPISSCMGGSNFESWSGSCQDHVTFLIFVFVSFWPDNSGSTEGGRILKRVAAGVDPFP